MAGNEEIPKYMNEVPENFMPGELITPAGDVSEKFVTKIHCHALGRSADYFWNMVDLKVGDMCVVETLSGDVDYGLVELTRRSAIACGCPKKKVQGKIIRPATEEDRARAEKNRQLAQKAMAFCRRRIFELDMQMSLSDVNVSYEGSKTVFHFTSEGRVDFRELLKDLSAFTNTRVEMRQIGVRDEAKLIGGCGPCGGTLCCSSFMKGFAPVSIRMAKDQNLSLNPTKISGICGRLMCCLSFEHEHYKVLSSKAPKMGKKVTDPDGKVGRVVSLNLLKDQVLVEYEDRSKKEFMPHELARGIVPKEKLPGAKPKVAKESPVATENRSENKRDRNRKSRNRRRQKSGDLPKKATAGNIQTEPSPSRKGKKITDHQAGDSRIETATSGDDNKKSTARRPRRTGRDQSRRRDNLKRKGTSGEKNENE